MAAREGAGRGGTVPHDAPINLRRPRPNFVQHDQQQQGQRCSESTEENYLIRSTQQMTIHSGVSENSAQFKGGGDTSNFRPSSHSGSGIPLNPLASEFIPRSHYFLSSQTSKPAMNGGENYLPEPPLSDDRLSDSSKKDNDLEPDDFFALEQLKDFMDIISSQPADYESLLPAITEVLNACMNEDPEILMICVVNTIFDQAIIDQNFRYNGVRLCTHLTHKLKVGPPTTASFKEVLLQRCQREHMRRDELAIATDGGLYIRGLTLFIGDLSTQTVYEELSKYVPDLINTLLAHPTTENLKCACMALKLCGSKLDLCAGRTQDVDGIIENLKSFTELSTVNSSALELIKSVIELRRNKWNSMPKAQPVMQNAYATGDSYVFNNYTGSEDYYPSYDFGGDEQDADVCSAFEEFLRASGQIG